MRKNKRNISFILAAVMLAVCLCSCTAKSAEKDAKPAPEAAVETQENAEAQGTAENGEANAADAQQAADPADAQQAAAPAEAGAEESADAAAKAGTETSAGASADTQAAEGAEVNKEAGIMPVYTLERHTHLEVSSDMLIASATYETVKLSEEAKEAYPALNEAMEALSAVMSEQSESSYSEIKEAAASSWADHKGSSEDFSAGDMTVEIEPVRCDGDVLSFFEMSNVYYPDSAHGLTGYAGYNYDTATGAPITLTDVVTDLSALLPAVAENLIALGDGMPVTDVESELKESFGENGEDLDWVLDRDALVLRFAPYEIASYARGVVEARIPYAKYPDLFTGKYGRYDGAFAKRMNPNVPVSLDLNGDGETETVFVTGSYGMDGSMGLSYSELEVTVGNMGCATQADFFSWSSVLAHTEDGRNIIIVETVAESDYPTLYVFKEGKSGPSLVGKMEGMTFASQYHDEGDDDGYVEVYPLLDPSAFALKEWSESGNTEAVFYEIGEDGMPVPLED